MSDKTSANSSTLPCGWERASLTEIAEINPPIDRCPISDTIQVNFVPMRSVEAEGGGLMHPELRPYGEVKKGYTTFLTGDVIMAKITPCMENGKTAVVPELPGQVCFGSTEFHVIRRQGGVTSSWIARYLLQHNIRRAAQRQMTGGVGQMRVPASFLERLLVPLAPSAEQIRIADALDELFSDLDAGVLALERVQEKLKLYRASVLKAAVEGSITTEWRAQHPNVEPASELLKRILVERRRRWEEEQLRKFKEKGREPPKNWKAKYKESVVPDTNNLPPLPEGWCWAGLDQIGELDRGRSKHRPRDAAFLYGGPYPFIQTGDVRKARQYLSEHSQTYSEEGLKQSRLWPAETLCITIAANIAETAILSYPACFPDSVVGITFAPSLVSVRYVEMFMRYAKTRISAYAPATAQKNINNEILRALAVPLPPLAEQKAIEDAAEGQLSVVDYLDDQIEAKLMSAKGLRQAILRHAFAGQLVPQDSNDEPASELLKRIAAEREARAKEIAAAKRTSKSINGPRNARFRRSKKKKTKGN